MKVLVRAPAVRRRALIAIGHQATFAELIDQALRNRHGRAQRESRSSYSPFEAVVGEVLVRQARWREVTLPKSPRQSPRNQTAGKLMQPWG